LYKFRSINGKDYRLKKFAGGRFPNEINLVDDALINTGKPWPAQFETAN
jgi:hypothetical protein